MFKTLVYTIPSEPEGVTNRRNVVLFANGKKENHHKRGKEKLQSLPIKLNFKIETHKDGTATYFREYLRDYMKNGLKKNQMVQIMTSTKTV
jgi:penicillin-binding protein 1A